MKKTKFFLGLGVILVSILMTSISFTYAIHDTSVSETVKKTIESFKKFEIPVIESTKNYSSSMIITQKGKVYINNGKIVSITGTDLIVSTWGIKFSIDAGQVIILPANTTFSNINVGDKVNINGTVNSITGTIIAEKIHTLSETTKIMDELRAEINKMLEQLKTLQKRLEEISGN